MYNIQYKNIIFFFKVISQNDEGQGLFIISRNRIDVKKFGNFQYILKIYVFISKKKFVVFGYYSNILLVSYIVLKDVLGVICILFRFKNICIYFYEFV